MGDDAGPTTKRALNQRQAWSLATDRGCSGPADGIVGPHGFGAPHRRRPAHPPIPGHLVGRPRIRRAINRNRHRRRRGGVTSAPDVVVLDLGLPDVGGGEVLKMIRAVASVPVIVATAQDDEQGIVRLFDAGADDYVIKPFSADHLAARIRAVLRRSGGKRRDRDPHRRPRRRSGGTRRQPRWAAARPDQQGVRAARLPGGPPRSDGPQAGAHGRDRRQPYGGADKTVDVHCMAPAQARRDPRSPGSSGPNGGSGSSRSIPRREAPADRRRGWRSPPSPLSPSSCPSAGWCTSWPTTGHSPRPPTTPSSSGCRSPPPGDSRRPYRASPIRAPSAATTSPSSSTTGRRWGPSSVPARRWTLRSRHRRGRWRSREGSRCTPPRWARGRALVVRVFVAEPSSTAASGRRGWSSVCSGWGWS